MNDMRPVIEPKSDQINADDLLVAPRTIKIRDVTIRPGTDQPVSIFFDGDNGKPYKCCKSMARVLVHAWGPDASKYVGRSMTLYCDPKVKWGGMEVGGIRISHMSNLDREMLLALTATKGKKAPFIVKPLSKAPASAPSPQQTPASPEAAPQHDPQPRGALSPDTPAKLVLNFINADGQVIEITNRPAFLSAIEAVFIAAEPEAALDCFFANQAILNDFQSVAFDRHEKAKTDKSRTDARAVLDRVNAVFETAKELQKAMKG